MFFSAETKTKHILPLLIQRILFNAQSDIVVFIRVFLPWPTHRVYLLDCCRISHPKPAPTLQGLPQTPAPHASLLGPIRREKMNCWAVDIFMLERALSKTRSSRKKNGHTIKKLTGGQRYICNRHMKMYSTSIIKEIPILNISIYQTGSFVKTISCLKSEAATLPPGSQDQPSLGTSFSK